MYLWLSRVILIAVLLFPTTLENSPYRVIMSQYESSCRNREIVVTKSSEFRVWMSKHHVCYTILKQTSDDHQYAEPFVALADVKLITEKARKQTRHELLRNTRGSLGAELSITPTALRGYRNRHLGTLTRCCAAWELVGNLLRPMLLRLH